MEQNINNERNHSTEAREMGFLDHLNELRWRILRSAIAVMFFSVLAFIYKDIMFDMILFAPNEPSFITNHLFCLIGIKFNVSDLCINSSPLKLINTNISGQFSLHMMVSFISGIVISMPYILFELWQFVKPALRQNEKKYTKGVVFWASTLFISGILFGYYIVTPLSINFLGTYYVSDKIENLVNVSSYISTVTSIVLIDGLVFQLPLIIYFFTKIGLITADFLRKYRRHAILVILIIGAIITPPDVFSQILVSIPLYLLFEVSIFVSRFVEMKSQVKN